MASKMVSFRVPLGIKLEQIRAPLAGWAPRPAPGCPKSHFWVPLEGFGGYSGRIFWHILGHCWDKFSDFFCVYGWGVVEAAPKARAKTTGIEETLLGSHHYLKCSC